MQTILVIREFNAFSEALIENNFSVINCPTIKTATIDDLTLFNNRLKKISAYDGIFLTSVKAAEVFLSKIREENISYQGKVFILGRRSFDLLKNEGFNIYYDELANTAQEMLEIMPKYELEHKNLLFLRGSISMRVIPNYLKNFAKIDEVAVYRTVLNSLDKETVKSVERQLNSGEIICTCFFSTSGVTNFYKIFGKNALSNTKIAAIGKTTAGHLTQTGVNVDFIPTNAAGKIFAEELAKYLKSGAA